MNQIEATITRIDPPTRDRDARAFVKSSALMCPQNPAGSAVFYADAWHNSGQPHVGQRVMLNKLVKTSRPNDPVWKWKALNVAPARVAVAPRPTASAQRRTVMPMTQESWFTRLLAALGLKNITGARAAG